MSNSSRTQNWIRLDSSTQNGSVPSVFGNGRMGAIVEGNVRHERIILKERHMWRSATKVENSPTSDKLPEIRAALLEGDHLKAENLYHSQFAGPSVCPSTHQALGSIHLFFPYHEESSTQDYSRVFDVDKNQLKIKYTQNKVKIQITAFCSEEHDLVVYRVESKEPNALNCSLSLVPLPGGRVITHQPNRIFLQGDHTDLSYLMGVRLASEDGVISMNRDRLVLEQATSFHLICGARTNRESSEYEEQLLKEMDVAASSRFDELQQDHGRRSQQHRDTANLSIHSVSPDGEGNKRFKKNLEKRKEDPSYENGDLWSLFFNYSLYLNKVGCDPKSGFPFLHGSSSGIDQAKIDLSIDYPAHRQCRRIGASHNEENRIRSLPSYRETPSHQEAINRWNSQGIVLYNIFDSVHWHHLAAGGFNACWPYGGFVAAHNLWAEHAIIPLDEEDAEACTRLFDQCFQFFTKHLFSDSQGQTHWGPSEIPGTSPVLEGHSLALDRVGDLAILHQYLDDYEALVSEFELDTSLTTQIHQARNLLPNWNSILQKNLEDPHYRFECFSHDLMSSYIDHAGNFQALESSNLKTARKYLREYLKRNDQELPLIEKTKIALLWNRLGKEDRAFELIEEVIMRGTNLSFLALDAKQRATIHHLVTTFIADNVAHFATGQLRLLKFTPASWSHGSFENYLLPNRCVLSFDWSDGSPRNIELTPLCDTEMELFVPLKMDYQMEIVGSKSKGTIRKKGLKLKLRKNKPISIAVYE